MENNDNNRKEEFKPFVRFEKLAIPDASAFKDADFETLRYALFNCLLAGSTTVPEKNHGIYYEYVSGMLAANFMNLVKKCIEENVKIDKFPEIVRDIACAEIHCVNMLIDYNNEKMASETAKSELDTIINKFSEINKNKEKE